MLLAATVAFGLLLTQQAQARGNASKAASSAASAPTDAAPIVPRTSDIDPRM